MYLVTSVNICTVMIEVLSEQWRSHFDRRYIQSAAAAAAAAAALCVPILLLLQQQCLCFLLLFVIVCRRVKFVASSLNLIPVFYFISFIRLLFLMYEHPLAVLLTAVSHLRP